MRALLLALLVVPIPLAEQARPALEVAFTEAEPRHLYNVVSGGFIHLRATEAGDVPELEGLKVPADVASQPPEGRTAALLRWISELIKASVPRLRIQEVGNFVSPRCFVLEVSGQWSLRGGFVWDGSQPVRSPAGLVR